jgi:hypothetical protein
MLGRRHIPGIAPPYHLSVGLEINFGRATQWDLRSRFFLTAAFFVTAQTHSLLACELLRFRSEFLLNADG